MNLPQSHIGLTVHFTNENKKHRVQNLFSVLSNASATKHEEEGTIWELYHKSIEIGINEKSTASN